MTTPSAAAVARIEAEMLDECEIREPPTQTTDPDTYEVVNTPGAVVYPTAGTGVCMFNDASRGSQTGALIRGDEPELQQPYQFSIPRDITAVRPGHHLAITAVGDDGDPAVIGQQFVVRRARYSTRMSRRILMCDLLEASAQ